MDGHNRIPEATEETAMPDFAEKDEFANGENIGRFVVGEEIGRGGMGVVYKAYDPQTGLHVAIKLMQNLESERALKRFLREIYLLGLVKSDFVSGFVATGEHKGQQYLAMEYVPGKSLLTRVKESDLSEEEALLVAGDVARGVAEIHAAGIVHRDIKPANIILSKWGTPHARAKLCDFGIARREGQFTDAVTRDGNFVGTPAYVAPEILTGNVGDVRSDVYSLGALLYAMTTGQPPFARRSVTATIAAQVHDPVPDLRKKRPEVSMDFADVVSSCLAREPSERPEDARTVLEQIELIRRGERRLLSQHPVLPKEAGQDATRTLEIEVILSSSPSVLWPFVSDTNRVNKKIGMAAVQETRHPGDEVVGVSKNWWGTTQWSEHPYEWVAPKRLGVVRVFSKGPLHWYRSTVEMKPANGGTKLVQKIEFAPKAGLASMLVSVEMRRLRKAFTKLYKQIDSVTASTPKPESNPFVAPRLRSAQSEQLDKALNKLQSDGIDSLIVLAMADYIRNANAQDAARLRPKEWARKYEFSEDRVIKTFLRAAKVGVFDLRWHLLCPTCQVPSSMMSVLAEMTEQGHCDACEVSFGLDFARNVELVFTVNERIRKPDSAIYCIGGPGNRPHIMAQVKVPQGQRFSVDLVLEAGTYQIAGAALAEAVRFSVSSEGVAERMELSLGRLSPAQDRLLQVGAQQIMCTNETAAEQVIKVEQIKEDDDVFSAAEALCLPLFRDLFEDELLPDNVFVHSTSTTILFAGLEKPIAAQGTSGGGADGVANYQTFAKLRKVIESAVAKEKGFTVKISGNGLMASFKTPGAAIRAGMAAVNNREGLEICASVETGTAVVTTVNRGLDFLGAVVDNAEAVYKTLSKGEFGLGPEIAGGTSTSKFLPAQTDYAAVSSVVGAVKFTVK